MTLELIQQVKVFKQLLSYLNTQRCGKLASRRIGKILRLIDETITKEIATTAIQVVW